MKFSNVDLHSHSVISDGTLLPCEVAKRARQNGVDLWSLTDHDEIGGQIEAIQTATQLGMKYLTGTEISVTYGEKTIHIVGLGFDINNSQLKDGLEWVRAGRIRRAKEISQRLDAIGIPNAYEGALTYVHNPNLISRTHFARYLVSNGVCDNISNVFQLYLADGKPAFVKHHWANLNDAVKWINDAGGIAVLAHPARYGLAKNQEYILFDEFKSCGGQGVEVVTSSHSVQEYSIYAARAEEFKLFPSRGSDFHSPDESSIDLGKLPPLPSKLIPIWEVLESRVID